MDGMELLITDHCQGWPHRSFFSAGPCQIFQPQTLLVRQALVEISKVADNRELQIQISDNVEIKIAPGMVADLYISNETKKNEPPKSNQKENKSGMMSNLLGKKK